MKGAVSNTSRCVRCIPLPKDIRDILSHEPRLAADHHDPNLAELLMLKMP
jgi:hypothetical protein